MKQFLSSREHPYVDEVAQGLHPPVVPLLPGRPEPRRVDHTYRDYSRYSHPAEGGGHQSGRKAQRENFPAKLHLILSTPEHSHVSRSCG